MLKRKFQREKRDLRKQVLGIDDQIDGSLQKVYGESTKTRRAIKVELFGSKSKASKYGEDTSLEIFVKNILDEAKIEYIPQKSLRYINVDYFVPSLKLVIQVHGDFWHINPKLYKEPTNDIQKRNLKKDKITNEIVSDFGYILLEIWENEIKKKPEKVKKELLKIISDIGNCNEKKEIYPLRFISSCDW